MGFYPPGTLAGAPRADRTVDATRWLRPAACGAAVLTAMLIATACSTVTDGAAHRSPGGPPPGAVDVSLLDTGNYPTRPAPPIGAAGTSEKGGLTEGVRMAGHVVGPWEVDTALAQAVRPTTVLKDAAALQLLLQERIAAAAGKHSYVTGFSSARRTEPDRMSLVNAVLRFADPPSAAAAATEFADLSLQPNDNLPPAQPVTIPNHPDTRASTFETTPPGSTTPETSVSAYTAHGPFVLHQFADTPDGVGPAADMVAKTLDQQIPAIDAFVPTPVSELADLAVDDSGLLARTIPQTGDQIPADTNQVYGPHAALHFQASPLASAQLFTDTGMDLWARGKASVYQVRDGEAAAKMLEQFTSESQDSGGKPVASVPNMPDSRCLQHEETLGTYVVCFAVVDRYVIEAGSVQIADVHQLSAAQYAMLTAS
jgi:hypothetical protein